MLEKMLSDYSGSGVYPMHMPGHKRNSEMMRMVNPYEIDVTETWDFDNLHEPSGVLARSMARAASMYGSDRTYYLVNGSSCGILAGISAAAKKGGKILMSRGCHKSVYNGVYLRDLEPVYIYPETDPGFGITGSIDPEVVAARLGEAPDIQLVVIASPTYEGVVSDIRSIAEIAHSYGVPLLVDAAHGAHFGFGSGFPERAIKLGADIVVESIHKTLPAFTQTSVLHVKSELINQEELSRQVSLFQSTSPSYILLCGIDKCMDMLSNNEKEGYFSRYAGRLEKFSEKMKALRHIRVLCNGNDTKEKHPLFYDYDKGKLVISVRGTGINGAELERILAEEFKIQLEMSLGDYGIAMTGICDTDEGFERLASALLELDGRLGSAHPTAAPINFPVGNADKTPPGNANITPPVDFVDIPPICATERRQDQVDCRVAALLAMTEGDQLSESGLPRADALAMTGASGVPSPGAAVIRASEAVEAEGELVEEEACTGRISQEYVYAYPPGIPLIVPGEVITAEVLEYLLRLTRGGNNVYSSYRNWPNCLKVVK